MKNNLATCLDLLQPWLSPALVSPAYQQCIRDLAEKLPPLSLGCYECWLGAESSRVDFNISIREKRREHAAAYRWTNSLKLDGHPAAWLVMQSICRNWLDPEFPLRGLLNDFWLVYDLPESYAPAPPWFYLRFRQNFLLGEPALRGEIALRTLALLPAMYTPATLASFRHFFETLAPTSQVLAIGTPTGRPGNCLRVYIRVDNWEDLLQVLEDQAWPGETSALRVNMDPFVVRSDFFGLALELNPATQPKIGIECWFEKERVQTRLESFTTVLLEKGLCTADKKDALLRWNGEFKVGKSSTTSLRKMAHYIKMVYEPDTELVAKSYLYFDRLKET